MKFTDSKKYVLSSIITSAIFGIILGVLLLALPVIEIVFVIVGIATILTNIPTFTFALVTIRTPEGKAAFFTSLLSLVFGFLIIFCHQTLLVFFLGAYLIVMPLIDVLFAKEKLDRFKAELPKLILGAVMILIGPAQSMEILFDIAGWVIIGLTAVYSIVMLILALTRKKTPSTTGTRIFADTDGDGTIDTVYVDTTGDGKADTSIPYKEEK